MTEKSKDRRKPENNRKVVVPDVPMSENRAIFRPAWTKDDCIGELRRIAGIDETQVITRNYYRNHAQCSESTWNRYFGTFLEYKRQAGIILSRHAHQLERNIAKHASKDKQRDMNDQKANWEGEYLRPSHRRFQTFIIASDIHDESCDPFYARLLVDTVRRVQPEKIILNGDIFDLTEFSKYTQDPRNFRVVERIRWVHGLLSSLREASPDSEILLVEGNHEFRLMRHLTEATPALVTVLSDLHGMTVPDLLGLTKYEVNYVARMDLSAFNEADIKREMKKNYLVLEESVLVHHFPEGFSMGMPGTNGHNHKHHVRAAYNPVYGPYEWHQTGCGHIRSASYCAAEKWSNGFLIAHVDVERLRTQFEYADTTHDHAIIGGRFYERTPDERIAA